ncbi:hypothetical protein D5S17_25640 [Pseudonocardiaceae bacterium YIM PH 21723]|nr:hypothetical protein D5S17_25640 [Pseudonocardiaceae bacterium YIM PH 21723]
MSDTFLEAIRRPQVTDWRLPVEDRLRWIEAELATHPEPPAGVPEALEEARLAVEQKTKPLVSWWTGWHVERAWRTLHFAQAKVIAADPRLATRLPALKVWIAGELDRDDPRVLALPQPDALDDADRVLVYDAVLGAFGEVDERHTAIRLLRNKLVVFGIALVLLLNLLVGILGSVHPELIPLCRGQVCPAGTGASGGDVWLVQLFGTLGAVIAVVVFLLRQRPSLVPYTLIGYQAAVKLVTGAALACTGVLALSSGLFDSVIKVETRQLLLFWALVFGYAQQIGTRLLDRYADRVLGSAKPLKDAAP